MKAVFGIRRFSSPLQPRRVSLIPMQLSGKDYVETVSSEALSVSFVARNQDELADSLLAIGDWTIGVVGKIFHSNHPAQVDLLAQLLAEFRAGGHELLRESFGEYVLVLIDKKNSDIFLFSDILSIRPVFHYEDSKQAVFGTDAWQLVSEDLVPPALDLNALSAWLLFDHVIGDRSIIEGLQRLPPASCLSLSDNGLKQEAYKHFHIDRRAFTERQLLERIESAVGGTCRAIVEREKRLNCFLSGGFDSRYLLSELEQSGADLHAYTVQYNSAEEDAAKAVLDALGVEGSTVDVPGSIFDLHDGSPFYFAPWGFPAWKFVTEIPVRRFNLRDTLVDGLTGDELIRGYDYEQQVCGAISQFGIGEGMLRSYAFADLCVFKPTLSERIRNRVKIQIEDYFGAQDGDVEKTAFQWLLFNRKSTCHTTNHMYNQAFVETTHPFVNHPLIDLRLEAEGRGFDFALYQKLLSRRFPSVAHIPHSAKLQQRYSGIGRFSWNLWRHLPTLFSQLMDAQAAQAFRRGFVFSRLGAYGVGQASQFYVARQLWIIGMLCQRLEGKGISIPWNEI